MAVVTEVRNRRVMRHVNALIWESLAAGGYPEELAFCECGEPGCYRPVWLTVTDYERACADPDRGIVATGHVPSTKEPESASLA